MMHKLVLPMLTILVIASLAGCGLFRRGNAPPEAPGACKEVRRECDSCSKGGFLGSRHIHSDCSETCDLICGREPGY